MNDFAFAPFASMSDLVMDALPALDPSTRLSVTEASERYVRIPLRGSWGAFDRKTAPYLVEPSDVTQSRKYRGGVFVGPSQSGKTSLLMTVAMHAVMCAPDPVQIIHMTKPDADAWVEEKLDPMIQNSPAIFERLGRGPTDSSLFAKRFRGMKLSIGYPVANQLSSRSQRMVLLTDYDHMDQRLGPKDAPEGSPWTMAMRRTTTYLSSGFVLAESSPARPVLDPDWRPDPANPHMLPPTGTGIVELYNDGTRGRWYWACPSCDQPFEPRFELMTYDETLDPADAGQSAVMACPHCGGVIEQKHRSSLNREALYGRGGWFHESSEVGEDGKRLVVRLNDPRIRNAETVSYHLNGMAAAFSSWANIVTNFELAMRKFRDQSDDIDLGTVYYTQIGVPYRRPDLEGEGALTVQVLRDNVRDLPKGSCPNWTRFITVSVDANGSWFAVLVTAWGLDGRRMLIDRFDLRQPADNAPRAKDDEGRYRALDPGKYAEDANVLRPLLDRLYPVQGEEWSLKPAAMVIDFNGPPGWPDNAEKFWRRCKSEGDGHRVFLSFGRGGFKHQNRVWLATPEAGSKGRKARSIKLLNMAVDRLKDSVLASLSRLDDGEASFALPNWAEDETLGELLAEVRTEKGYLKRPGAGRNETLDLAVQALALAEYRNVTTMKAESAPDWAQLRAENVFAVWTGKGRSVEAAPAKRIMRWAQG